MVTHSILSAAVLAVAAVFLLPQIAFSQTSGDGNAVTLVPSTTSPDANKTDLCQLLVKASMAVDPNRTAKRIPKQLLFDKDTGSQVAGIGLFLCSVDGALAFSEGVVPAKRYSDGKLGYVDPYGQCVVDFQYDAADSFREGRAVVVVGEEIGMIDGKGNWIVRPGTYSDLRDISEGRIPYRQDKKWGFLDADGNVVISAQFYDGIEGVRPCFSNGRSFVRKDKTYVCIDKGGRVVFAVPQEWTIVEAYSQGAARVCAGNWGFIDADGNVTIPFSYKAAGDFSEGLAPVSSNSERAFSDCEDTSGPAFDDEERWGYIDRNGNMVIPATFQCAGKFYEGTARVCSGGLWGYIDKSGKWIVTPQFLWAGNFHNGFAAVRLAGKETMAFLNRTGKIVVDTGVPGSSF